MDIMPALCKCLGIFRWTNSDYTNSSILERSGFVHKIDDSHNSYDDIIKGSYNGVGIEIVEAKIRNNNMVTMFGGIIIKLGMNKNFRGRVVLSPKITLWDSHLQWLKKIKLEDADFRRAFNIYADSEIEARYILTPAFMERLKNLKTVFRSGQLNCVFYKRSVIIGIHTRKDFFSLGSLIRPLGKRKPFLNMIDEFISVIKLVDYFKLDEKIGL